MDALEGVDEGRQLVYFSATLQHPTERHLYVAPFSGGEACRLTQEPGAHTVVLDHACKRYLDTFHSLTESARRSLCVRWRMVRPWRPFSMKSIRASLNWR